MTSEEILKELTLCIQSLREILTGTWQYKEEEQKLQTQQMQSSFTTTEIFLFGNLFIMRSV